MSGGRRQTIQRRKTDEVTQFAQSVAELTRKALSDELRPEWNSQFAKGSNKGLFYDLWYKRHPWERGRLCHRIIFRPESSGDKHLVHVRFFD